MKYVRRRMLLGCLVVAILLLITLVRINQLPSKDSVPRSQVGNRLTRDNARVIRVETRTGHAPVHGARVVLSNPLSEELVDVGVTAINGELRCPLARGSWLATVARGGFRPVHKLIDFGAAGNQPMIVELSEGGARVIGSVVNSSGEPIQGARVCAKATRELAPYCTFSHSNGEFQLDIALGTFRFEVAADRYAPENRSVGVDNDTELERFILLPPSAISGTVVREDGSVVAGATIEDVYSRQRTTSDIAGEYTLTGLRPGDHTLTGRAPGLFSRRPVDVTVPFAGGAVADIVVVPAFSVHGRVFRRDGTPVVLELREIDGGASWNTVASTDGSFTFDSVPFGDYDVVATVFPDKTCTRRGVSVVNGPVTGVDIDLSGDSTVSGFVLPRRSSLVMLTLRSKENVISRVATTDESGGFVFDGVPLGNVELVATSRDGMRGATQFEHRRSHTKTHVDLQPRATIVGNVVDPAGAPVTSPSVHVSGLSDIACKDCEIMIGQDGGFTIHGLQSGTYRVSVMYDDFRSAILDRSSKDLVISDGETITGVLLELPTLSAIRGVVVDERGAGVPDALVVAHTKSMYRERYAVTDGRGEFELDSLGSGDYDVVAESSGRKGHRTHAHPGGVVEIRLEPTVAIKGKVTLGARHVSYFRVVCRSSKVTEKKAVLSPTGEFVMEGLPRGMYMCSVDASEGSLTRSVTTGDDTIVFDLRPWGEVDGVVRDIITKAAVPGALVIATYPDPFKDASQQRSVAKVVTDVGGRFRVHRVGDGKGFVSVLTTEGGQGYWDFECSRSDCGPPAAIEVNMHPARSAGTLGLETAISESDLVVTEIEPGLPAGIAGMQVGDRIVAVEGSATSTLGPGTAFDLLRDGSLAVGQPLRLSLRRADIRLEVTVVVVRRAQ